jgi:AcrR family transcriptional regulator
MHIEDFSPRKNKPTDRSGLFAHWPDKETLQLAVVAQAVRQWTERIVVPALAAPRGVRRLLALHEHRLAFARAGVLDRLRALSPQPELLPEE